MKKILFFGKYKKKSGQTIFKYFMKKSNLLKVDKISYNFISETLLIGHAIYIHFSKFCKQFHRTTFRQSKNYGYFHPFHELP